MDKASALTPDDQAHRSQLGMVRIAAGDPKTGVAELQQVIELDDFALQRGFLITWDIEPAGLNTIELLRTIDNASFDRAYMNEMVTKHEKAAANLKVHIANSDEAASLAAKALSIAQRHRDEARLLQARL